MADTLTVVAQSVGIVRDVVVIAFFVCAAWVFYRKMLNPQSFVQPSKFFDGATFMETLKAFRQDPSHVSSRTTSRANAMHNPNMEDDGVFHNTFKRRGVDSFVSRPQRPLDPKSVQHDSLDDLLASMNASTQTFKSMLLAAGLDTSNKADPKSWSAPSPAANDTLESLWGPAPSVDPCGKSFQHEKTRQE
jgi:hypothetical protein